MGLLVNIRDVKKSYYTKYDKSHFLMHFLKIVSLFYIFVQFSQRTVIF